MEENNTNEVSSLQPNSSSSNDSAETTNINSIQLSVSRLPTIKWPYILFLAILPLIIIQQDFPLSEIYGYFPNQTFISFTMEKRKRPEKPQIVRFCNHQPSPNEDISVLASVANISWDIVPDTKDPFLTPRLRLFLDGETPTVSYDQVRQCLSDQHIVLMGDSLTRYQYLNLVYYLTHRSWYSPAPHSEAEKQWGSWKPFYEGTTKRHTSNHTYEICDCHRFDHTLEHMMENRYFTDTSINLRVTYLQVLFTSPFQAHNLEWLNVECKIKRNITDTAPHSCQQTGCAVGDCTSTPDIQLSPPQEVIQFAVDKLDPTVIIFNSGLWGSYTPHKHLLDGLVNGGNYALNHSQRPIQFYWKMTTVASDKPYSEQKETLEEYRVIVPLLSTVSNTTDNKHRWRMYDTFRLSSGVNEIFCPLSSSISEEEKNAWKTMLYWNNFHFEQPVYRGLNEVLLMDLMRNCKKC